MVTKYIDCNLVQNDVLLKVIDDVLAVDIQDVGITVSGTITAVGGLTDTELRASDVKVTLDSEAVTIASLPDVEVARETLLYACNISNTSGDVTLVSGVAGQSIYVSTFVVQNESATATTMLLKDGANVCWRILGQSQGDGLAITKPVGREWKLTTAANLILNLSGANQCGYSIEYFIK